MKLKRLEVNSFGGISPASPIVIDFSESKMVKAIGDSGVGKTSLLNALLVACGQLSKDNTDFVNNESGKIDINFSFQGKDRFNYEVRITKSSFKLMYDGEAIAEPISKMKELLGVTGISPMSIKDKPLKEIVKWLSSYSNKSAEDYEKETRKLKDSIKAARDSRAIANKSLKSLNEYLENEPMYKAWEESEKKYDKPIDVKDLLSERDKSEIKANEFKTDKNSLERLKVEKKNIEDEIEKLVKRAEAVNASIERGEKKIEENKNAETEYLTAKAAYDNAYLEVVNFNKWADIKGKKKDKDEFETLSQKADAQGKELMQKMKELQTDILPDIKGVEIVLEDTQENGKKLEEGLYWNGRNVAQLSQTEWWNIVMAIWRKYKVKVIVIDNYGELGSLAEEMLTKLHNDGAYILAAEMDRKQKTLEIVYEQSNKLVAGGSLESSSV